MASTPPTITLTLSYPHLPGFTLFAYQLKQDLEDCFQLEIQTDAVEGTLFSLQTDTKIIFRTAAHATTDIERETIYKAVCTLCDPTGPMPPVAEFAEKIDKEWLDCLCSGE